MQTHNPTTEMATASAIEAGAEAVMTKTGDKSPSAVLVGGVNASSDTAASDHFFEEDAIYVTSDEARQSSVHENPSGAFDSDSSHVRSATITHASRQQLELRDGLAGSADTKIPSDSHDVRAGIGSYVFKACMISISFLLVISSPLLLCHLYSYRDSELLALLWDIAAFISAYIVFLIFIFSPTMSSLSSIFFHIPCPVLLAIAADRFVGPYVGFSVMHMATGWLAGLLGYAYAERLQHTGRETTAKLIASPTFLTEEEERFYKAADRGGIAALFGLMSVLLVSAGTAPLGYIPMEILPISVAFLSVMDGGAILCWVVFVARFVLYDALLSMGQLGHITLCYICPYLVMSCFLLPLLGSYGLTSFTIGATFFWWLMLSIAGLLGYALSVHAQCKQMMLSRQQLELSDGLGSADTKIPSDSNIATVTLASLCGAGSGSYVFEACMISISFLLVLSSPLLLLYLYSYSELLTLLWNIAAFISTCIVFLIFIFSPTMCLSSVFFHIPCTVLLAIAADRFVGPYVGFLVMQMATGWLAGLLGYDYAEHLQHIGRETTAKLIASPNFLTEEEERFFKTDRGGLAAVFGLLSLLLVTVGIVPFWFFSDDILPIFVAFLPFWEGAAIFCWVSFVARFVLYDALLSADHFGQIMCYICSYVAMGFFLILLLGSYYGLIGLTIAATFLWCFMLSLAGLLGYELSVYDQCKQMMPSM